MVIANLVYCVSCDKLIESEDRFLLLSSLPQNYSKFDGICINGNDNSKIYCEKCTSSIFDMDIKRYFQPKKKSTKTK